MEKTFDKQLLTNLLAVQTHSGNEKRMVAFIKQWCVRNKYKLRMHKGNMYIVKGKANLYPCYVAHTDSVHRIIKEMDTLDIVEHNGALIALDNAHTQVGIGGDDKVGIYIALRMLKQLSACKVALFHSEEIGCIGSRDADVKFFADCAFVLQADRRGNKDFVTSIGSAAISSDDFQQAVKPIAQQYGFAFSTGAMTDVEQLSKRGIGISCANVSCGYYNPHMDNEYVVLADVANTEQLFVAIGRALRNVVWTHKYVAYTPTYAAVPYSSNKYSGTYYYDSAADWADWIPKQSESATSELPFEETNAHNSSGSWVRDTEHGWLKRTNFYCPHCIDEAVHERMSSTYYRYYCQSCKTLLMQDEALTTEQAIAQLYNDNYTHIANKLI